MAAKPADQAAAPKPTAAGVFDDTALTQLLINVGRAHRNVAGALLRRVGLFPGQELLLMQLWRQDDQPQADLTSALGIEPSTVTKMLQRLEQNNLVHRRRPPENQRIVIVSLTERGRALRAEVQSVWEEFHRLTVAGLSPAEIDRLGAMLRRLERNLANASGAGGRRPAEP